MFFTCSERTNLEATSLIFLFFFLAETIWSIFVLFPVVVFLVHDVRGSVDRLSCLSCLVVVGGCIEACQNSSSRAIDLWLLVQAAKKR
jgi:hypothetical protein